MEERIVYMCNMWMLVVVMNLGKLMEINIDVDF